MTAHSDKPVVISIRPYPTGAPQSVGIPSSALEYIVPQRTHIDAHTNSISSGDIVECVCVGGG